MKKRIPWNKGKKGVQKAWNKGLTKETDERVRINTERRNKTMEENGLYGGKKGKKYPGKSSEAKKREKNPSWLGDDVSYRGLHNWMRKNHKSPKKCQLCKEKRKLDLANVTGKYTRKIKNYRWLCRKCHSLYDKGNAATIYAVTHKLIEGDE